MTKKLIIEYYKGDKGLSQINESVDNLPDVPSGMMRVEGVVGVVDTLNRNKRKYPKNSYKKLIEGLQGDIKDGLYGEMEHPTSMNIDNNNISHKIERLWLDESTGEVKATFLLLGQGTKGLIAQNIVRSGGALRASSRGAGDMVGEDVHLEVLRTYDLVGTPGFKESKMYNSVGESLLTESYVYNEESDTCTTKKSDEEDDNSEYVEEIVERLLSKRLQQFQETQQQKPTIDISTIVSEITESVMVEVGKKTDIIVNRVDQFLESYNNNTSKIVNESNNGINESDLRKTVLTLFKNDIAPIIEKWTIEEFMPDMLNGVQNWIVEEYSPNVQNWIVEEYSPNVQNWITTEYSEGVQNWITNEYSQGVQNWLTDNGVIKEQKDNKEGVASEKEEDGEELEDKSSDNDDNEEEDNMNESATNVKKTIKMTNDILSRITEKMTNMGNRANVLNEGLQNGGKEDDTLLEKYFGDNAKPYLKFMPESMKIQYISTDDNTKQLIETKANMRVLNTKEDIYEFWSNLDVQGLKSQKQFIPSYTRNVNEQVIEQNKENNRQNAFSSALFIAKNMLK